MFRVAAQLMVVDGLAYQSVGFTTLVCLGRLDIALEALARQMPDEIVITSLEGRISEELSGISQTIRKIDLPLVASGGADYIDIGFFPIERTTHNSALFNKFMFESLRNDRSGRQSRLGYLPFRLNGITLEFFDSSRSKFFPVEVSWLFNLFSTVQELILIDADGQGKYGSFNSKILDLLPEEVKEKCYFSGGASMQDVKRFKDEGCAGYLLENVSLYSNRLIFREYNEFM